MAMKSALLVLVILAIWGLSSVHAQCATGSDCSTCTAIPGCGWCAATQQCLAGNSDGPTSAQCNGIYSWDFGMGNCQECSVLKGCKVCTEQPDCQWCGSSCITRDAVCTTRATTCPCEAFVGCADCTSRSGCVWCEGLRTCATAGAIPPDQQNCTFSQICKCSAVNECFECKSQEGCGYCAIDNKCYNLASFPEACLPARSCPIPCSKDACGERNCGPFDSCQGSCGTCQSGEYCSNNGICKHVPSSGGNFVGGMILGIGLVVIGIGAYAFYQKRKQASSNAA